MWRQGGRRAAGAGDNRYPLWRFWRSGPLACVASINRTALQRVVPHRHPLRVIHNSEYAYRTDYLQIRLYAVGLPRHPRYPLVAFGHEPRFLAPFASFSLSRGQHMQHTRICRVSTVLEDATWRNSSDNNTSMLSSLMPSTRPARHEFELPPETRTRGAFRASFGLGLHNPLARLSLTWRFPCA